MVCFIAFYFVLRLVLAGVMRVPLVIDVLRMDLDNPAADMPGLGIPGDVVADFESLSHLILPNAQSHKPVQHATITAHTHPLTPGIACGRMAAAVNDPSNASGLDGRRSAAIG
jgi:hypothetical protein